MECESAKVGDSFGGVGLRAFARILVLWISVGDVSFGDEFLIEGSVVLGYEKSSWRAEWVYLVPWWQRIPD